MVTICEHCNKPIVHSKKSSQKVINLFECPYCLGNIGGSYRLRISEEEYVLEDLYIEEYIEDTKKIVDGEIYSTDEIISYLM